MMLRAATVVAALVLLSGCPPPWHTHDEPLFVQGVAPLNPDAAGRSQAVDVRIYQLRDDEGFLSASPEDLVRDDKGILGKDLVTSRTLTLQPADADRGTLTVYPGERADETRYFGILVLYPGTRAKGESWHAAVLAGQAPTIVFQISGRTLRVVGS